MSRRAKKVNRPVKIAEVAILDPSKIAVHAYEMWDPHRGVAFRPFDKRTEDGIALLGGTIIPGTAEYVDPADIVANGRYERKD